MKRAVIRALPNLVKVLIFCGGAAICIKWADLSGPDLFMWGAIMACVAVAAGDLMDRIIEGAI